MKGVSVRSTLQMLHAAHEMQIGIAHQDARQQARLAGDLKPVADGENPPAPAGMGPHRIHDGGARRDGAAAQVIAIGEAAGQEHEVGAGRQARFGMPDEVRLASGHEPQGPRDVALAIDPGEQDDRGLHARPSRISIA